MPATLVKPSEPWAMTADAAAQCGVGRAAASELALRNALEVWCRARWPSARIVHEIVMGEGRVRADVAAIDTANIAAFEVKGEYDDTTRLLHQVGMFQLCVPEVWMVVSEKHTEDADLIHWLLPSIGLLTGTNMSNWPHGAGRAGDPVELTIRHAAVPRTPVPEMALRVLWADELRAACAKAAVYPGMKATRATMVKDLLERIKTNGLDVIPLICEQLRARDALWRADPPVTP